jgi:cytochrome c peroxidase
MQYRFVNIVVVIAVLVCLGATSVDSDLRPTIDNKRAGTPFKLEYPTYFGNRIFIPADNPTTEEGVQLGRMLFYETKLSANNQISCAHCHQQERAFTDGLTFSKGVDGTPTPRNSMSLANLLWIRNFFWDGRVNGLEAQAQVPLTDPHEMGQALVASARKLQQTALYPPLFNKAFGTATVSGDLIVKALAQFERTLISANSKYDQYLRGAYKPNASELNGMALFFGNPDMTRNVRGASCGHCHGGPKTFSELFHNNGLDSVATDAGREKITGQSIDRGRFRVATLRNIALTAPYMHDGRFSSLEQVVDHYNEHIQPSATLSTFLQNNQPGMDGTKLGLTVAEKKDLVAFLHLLTDSSFITDKRFSNPFIK